MTKNTSRKGLKHTNPRLERLDTDLDSEFNNAINQSALESAIYRSQTVLQRAEQEAAYQRAVGQPGGPGSLLQPKTYTDPKKYGKHGVSLETIRNVHEQKLKIEHVINRMKRDRSKETRSPARMPMKQLIDKTPPPGFSEFRFPSL